MIFVPIEDSLEFIILKEFEQYTIPRKWKSKQLL